MSLCSQYQAFLASPAPGALAESAALHYVPTLTSIHEPQAIVKHFAVQERLLKKKGQKILSAIEGDHGLSVDVETTIEFVSGGGAYLPGLDDNFVADRTVTFPMIHMVHFDQQGKIIQIRQYWDQGSLLKQIDVIGARARNWPIRDGKDQTKLVLSSASHVRQQPETNPASRPSTGARGADEVSIHSSSSRRSTNNAMNDPHASLSLFQPRQISEEHDVAPSRPIAPRAQSAKPPPREYSELFVGESAPSPSPRNGSTGIPVKAGGGKNFKPSRLFDEAEQENVVPTPMSVKTNAKKYNHFEFGNGEDDQTPKGNNDARPASRSQHASSWDFEDFVTPAKTKQKIHAQAVRHFGWSDDEEEVSPIRREVVHKPRPDAAHQFEFQDDGTPEGQRKAPGLKGRLQNKGLGLYRDHVTGSTPDEEDDNIKGDVKRPLNDVTSQIKNENRQKDFSAHFEMRDDSPRGKQLAVDEVPELKKKAIQNNFDMYDKSPDARGINIAGNGMGARKGTNSNWSLYDESPDPAKKENAQFKSMGNGMGGRKGATSTFSWEF